jgi:DNA repair exonuclease SbcCD ATPase subunit
VDLIGESSYICYELVEEIIFNIFNTSIIEPYVKLNAVEDVVIEPDKVHKWTPEVTKCYIEMGREYKKYGIIACDALEEGFKNYFKGKNINGEPIVHPQEKKLYEEMKLRLKRENKQSKLFIERRREIEGKVQEYKKKKKEERKEKLRKMKELMEAKKEEQQSIQEKFSKVQEKQKQQYDEKISKLKERQNKIKEKNDKRDKELIEFYQNQKTKIDSQMKEILEKRKEYLNKFKEKKEEKKLKINPRPSYIDKDKEYIDFDNKFIDTMENLRKREDINLIFEKYSKHLKTIYDIYSKIGNNKISFYARDCIRINEFKQFLINFAVLGILISTDQMNWIFNKISKSNLEKKERQSYLDYDDFQITLILLAIFSRFTEKSKKILPNDLNSTNGETVEYFFKFLGFKIPFNKLEMENLLMIEEH